MILEVDDTKTISDLQDRFSLCFPLLRIEFCKKNHGWEDTCKESGFYDSDMNIMSIRKNHEPGTLEIKSWNKVGEVEKEFYHKFGLSVQIFYKSVDRWMQTGEDDKKTLAELQEQACA